VCQTDGRSDKTDGQNCDGYDALKAVAAFVRKNGIKALRLVQENKHIKNQHRGVQSSKTHIGDGQLLWNNGRQDDEAPANYVKQHEKNITRIWCEKLNTSGQKKYVMNLLLNKRLKDQRKCLHFTS